MTLDVRIGLYDDPPNKETLKMLEETCKFFPFLERFGGLWEGLLLRFGLSSTTYREFCQTEDNAIEIGQKIVNQKVKELSINGEDEFVENQGSSNITFQVIFYLNIKFTSIHVSMLLSLRIYGILRASTKPV